MVDRDIPPPEDVHKGKRKYPWYEMAVGESFFVKGKTATQLAASYAQVQRKTLMRFTARKWPGGVRVWRISMIGPGMGLAAYNVLRHWDQSPIYTAIHYGKGLWGTIVG